MTGVCRGASSDGAIQSARHDGVSRRAANVGLRAIAKGVNTTGSLQAVAAA
ncbi:MAG: hypothetical protein MUO77_17950 [Anaerolineales bacterium]|nr:hypothetical protein [Anaerolineales bacterium]